MSATGSNYISRNPHHEHELLRHYSPGAEREGLLSLEATGSNYISRNPSQAFTKLSEREGAEREGAEREGAERRDY